MANKTKIKFAVLGYGNIGKRHVDVLVRNPETELVAICDIGPGEYLVVKTGRYPFSIRWNHCWI